MYACVHVIVVTAATCVSPSSSGVAPTLEEVCHQILPNADLLTMFSMYAFLSMTLFLLPPPKKEVMFLVRSVCLSVRLITRKLVNGF